MSATYSQIAQEKKKSSLHCICHFSEVLDCVKSQGDRLFVKKVRRQDGADIKPRAERVVESGVGTREQQCPLVARQQDLGSDIPDTSFWEPCFQLWLGKGRGVGGGRLRVQLWT